MSTEKTNITPRRLVALAVVVTVAALGAVVFSGCDQATPATDWTSPNGNLKNTRYVGGRINESTIDSMGVAWTVDLKNAGAFGAIASNPIIAEGAVFVQDLKSNVFSYDLQTGKLNWKKMYDEDNVGPNGVTWNGDDGGVIYGATKTFPFALDAKTGKEIWATKGLAKKTGAGFTVAPQVYDGRVHISTAAQPGGGVAFALDQRTGKKLWAWNSILKDEAPGNAGTLTGGSWSPPLVHDNSVFWGTGNPYQTINEGTKTPKRGRYGNSTVRLNARTGKLEWSNQVVPNDFYDWDQHLSPILTKGKDEQQLILDGGKHGYVYAFDIESGDTVWKTAVGTHNGHDSDPANALKGDFKPEKPLNVAPGTLGGVETNMAVADQTVYAATVDLPATYKDFDDWDPFKVLPGYDTGKGELTAIDVESGDVKWEKQLASMPYGAVTIANDLVFTTTYDGNIYAFDKDSGDQEWTSKLPAGANSPIAISDSTIIVPAGINTGKGQKLQLVAFRIGGVGQVGGAAAPEIQKTEEGERAGASKPGQSGGSETESEGSGAGGQPSTPAVDAKQLFTQNCGGCHTLSDAGTSGNVGPNLDTIGDDMAKVQKQIENGGGGMPAFKGTLSPEEIAALAKYVASVDGS